MSINRWMDKEVVVHIHNGILLSHKKEHIWVSSDEMDKPRAYYYIEWSESESSVQFSRSVMSVSLQPHEPQHARHPCSSPTPGVHPNHVHRVGDAIQPSHPLLSPSPPALNLSQHQVFSNESALRIRWPKYWSLSFSISPSDEHPRLISFRIDWLDLLAVQGTLKSLLQHHSSKDKVNIIF